jgi:peptidoglycan/LPS O-acetylase OafA/YrhL
MSTIDPRPGSLGLGPSDPGRAEAGGGGPSSMCRVPEFDSIRAIAAVAILLFHIDPPRFYPGWSGVDLFFVLSGYLITRNILEHGDSRGFLARFYARRSLRIWPIYYLALFGVVAVNPFLSPPQPMSALPWYLTYTQNLWLLRPWPPPEFTHAFDHTWTLAIEEQFYLIWPALVLVAGRRHLAALCLMIMAMAVAARTGGYPLFFYSRSSERLLYARCDGFALGGLLSLWPARDRWTFDMAPLGRLVFGLAAAGSLAYLVHGGWNDGGMSFIGLPTPSQPGPVIFAFSLLYAGLVGLVLVHAGRPVLAPLRARWLVYLGQMSYGIYLYHYLVYWAVDRWWPQAVATWWGGAIKVAISLAIAAASWHAVERPILALKDRFRYGTSRAKAPPAAVARDLDS